MAMNTRNKRASSVQLMASYILAPPQALGAIDQTARQHIAWTYAGILASGATFVYTRLERRIRGVMRGVVMEIR